MDDYNLKDNLDLVFGKLENFLKTETVVGQPIKIGETTLIPFISVAFGCGGGGGNGEADKNLSGSGSGLGACAKLTPNAVLVIKDNEVTMLPVKTKTNLEKLINMVPDIATKFSHDKSKCCKDESSEE